MKPSQRVYQQRDIAKREMDKYAGFLAERMVLTPVTERQNKTTDSVIKSHTESYRKWRAIYNVLTTEGAIASAQEQSERKQRKKEYEASKIVVEEKTKEDTHNNLVNPFGDYVQRQMDAYLSTTTNTVTLNTSLPPTGGKTYTFTIPRFKVAPAVDAVEEEVEGII